MQSTYDVRVRHADERRVRARFHRRLEERRVFAVEKPQWINFLDGRPRLDAEDRIAFALAPPWSRTFSDGERDRLRVQRYLRNRARTSGQTRGDAKTTDRPLWFANEAAGEEWEGGEGAR